MSDKASREELEKHLEKKLQEIKEERKSKSTRVWASGKTDGESHGLPS